MKKLLGKLVFVVVGIALIILGIVLISNDNKLKDVCTVEVTGVVAHVDIYHETDNDGDTVTYYTPCIEFDYKDESYQIIGEQSEENEYNVGDEIVFKINPNKPTEVLFGDGTPVYVYLIIFALGVIFILGGIFGRHKGVAVKKMPMR